MNRTRTGNFLSDLGNVLTHPADDLAAIGQVIAHPADDIAAIGQALGNNPVTQAVMGVLGDAVDAISTLCGSDATCVQRAKQIASGIGTVVSTAFGSYLYMAAAPVLGAQVASVAFAVPGVLQGDSFGQAYADALSGRIAKTMSIAGPQVAQGITSSLGSDGNVGPAVQWMEQKYQDIKSSAPSFPDVNKIAADAGIPPQAAMFATSQLKKIIPPPDVVVNQLTQKVYASIPSAAQAALGIPVDPNAAALAAQTNLSGAEKAAIAASYSKDVEAFLAAANQSMLSMRPNDLNLPTMTPGYATTPDGRVTYPITPGHPAPAGSVVISHPQAPANVVPPNVAILPLKLNTDGSIPKDTQSEDALNATLRSLKQDPASTLYTFPAVATWMSTRGIAKSRLVTLNDLLSRVKIDGSGNLLANADVIDAMNGILKWMKNIPGSLVSLPYRAMKTWLVEHAIDPVRINAPNAAVVVPMLPVPTKSLAPVYVQPSGSPYRSASPPPPITMPGSYGYNRLAVRSAWTTYYDHQG